jgi:hypothetical protein
MQSEYVPEQPTGYLSQMLRKITLIQLEAISKIPWRRGSASYKSARMQGENARRCIRCDTASTFSPEDDAIS